MEIKYTALVIQFAVSVAFNLMGSFLPLYINTELNYVLIEATYWAGLSQFAAATVMSLTAPLWGYMCDRFGTKRIMMIVLLGNTVVYAGMSLATNATHVLLFRGLQGAMGGLSTVMFVLVTSIVSGEELRSALSYQMAAMTMGSIIGPGLGGFIAHLVGYRLTFATTSTIFLTLIPLIYGLKTFPQPQSKRSSFQIEDLKSILPDSASLILTYISISFIAPTIPWFLGTLGVSDEQLLTYTAVTATLTGIAFAIATPISTKIITYRTLPILSITAAFAIFATAFVREPYQFIALRIIIGALQAGAPPSLLGGKSGRKGASIGILNSARFMGMAIGPYAATTILGDGTPPRPLYMFTIIAGISILAAILIFSTHTRRREDETG